MEDLEIRTTVDAIEEFKKTVLWADIKRELNTWSQGFQREMLGIVEDAADNNPSTASVLLHMGDLNGRQKAVDYFTGMLDVFINILESDKEVIEDDEEVSDG